MSGIYYGHLLYKLDKRIITMFMYIEDHQIYKPICQLLLDQGYTEANGENLDQFYSMDETNDTYRIRYRHPRGNNKGADIPKKPMDVIPEDIELYRGFIIRDTDDRKSKIAFIETFYKDALTAPTSKILTSNEHTMKCHNEQWGYSKSKLGQHLLQKALGKTYDNWFNQMNDMSLEHYDHIVAFVNSLTGHLHCTESVDGNTYRYTYKDAVLFEANDEIVTFPAINAILKQFNNKDPEILDNPLLGFLEGFLAVSPHCYGPAQGRYNMYYSFYVGYLISHYPESREWLMSPSH